MTILGTDDSLVCAGLRIAFPGMRDVEEKVAILSQEIKTRVSILSQSMPITPEKQEEIRLIYQEYLRLRWDEIHIN